jgi:hypothetical protein
MSKVADSIRRGLEQAVAYAKGEADLRAYRVAAARRSHRTADAAPVVADAVRRAEMDPEQARLDELLK